MSISSEDLIEYNKMGLIPGPEESEEDYLTRVEFCLLLKKNIQDYLKEKLPLLKKEGFKELTPTQLDLAEKLYDIRPLWVPVVYSNHQLSPWHGACAWIFRLTKNSPTATLLQIRKRALYSKEELLTHEICHVGRMLFEEPMFEEILAYRCSKSWFRRVFGPIVQSSFESMLFVAALFMIAILDAFALFSGHLDFFLSLMWLKLIPLGMVGYAVIRLWRRHHLFYRAWKKLFGLLKDKKKTNAVLYRLTDDEIIRCAWVKKNEKTSLRWRLLREVYLGSSDG